MRLEDSLRLKCIESHNRHQVDICVSLFQQLCQSHSNIRWNISFLCQTGNSFVFIALFYIHFLPRFLSPRATLVFSYNTIEMNGPNYSVELVNAVSAPPRLSGTDEIVNALIRKFARVAGEIWNACYKLKYSRIHGRDCWLFDDNN